MKHLVTFSLLLLSLASVAQKQEFLFDFNWRETPEVARARYLVMTEKTDSGWLRQSYYLPEKRIQMSGLYLDSLFKIPVGRFVYYHSNGVLEASGQYVLGKREGVWISYHDNRMTRDSSQFRGGKILGTSLRWYANGFLSDSSIFNDDESGLKVQWFDNGNPSMAGPFTAGRKRQGKWQYFHRNGQLSAIEIFEEDKLKSRQYYSEEGQPLSDTASRDRDAEFTGGLSAWKQYLQRNLYFPKHMKMNGLTKVTVVVDWVISEEGKVEDVKISAPFHPEFDRIALQVIRKSPDWQPAIGQNRRVKTYRRQPVSFYQE